MYEEVFDFQCGKCGVVRKFNFGAPLLMVCRKKGAAKPSKNCGNGPRT